MSNSSAPQPSWQELARNGRVLYTVEETTPGNWSAGAVTSYRVGADGALAKIASAPTFPAVVSLAISPNGKLVVAAS